MKRLWIIFSLLFFFSCEDNDKNKCINESKISDEPCIEIYEGFSWPCLFFGFMWYLVKGMFGWAIVNFLVAGFTFGISMLVFPFFANNHRKESLLKKGYLSEPKSDK